MSLRSNLADNLRRLTNEIGSANFVCRELDINRQQFEKYLKGRSLPSPTTLRKICNYFKISEEELFAAGAEPEAEREAIATPMAGSCDNVLGALFSEPPPSIKPGIYFLWMTVPTQPDHVVCAPVFIERDNDRVTFRRITGSAEPSDRLWFHRVGDHKGVVVQRLNWLLLVAVNQRGIHEPSMIRLKSVPLSSVVLGGHATILTPTGISFAAVCMRPAPAGTSFRQALRQSRQFEKNDPTIDSVAKMVLDQERKDLLQIIERDVSRS
jgi:transcriptional regulator with XRE-family HTH domain